MHPLKYSYDKLGDECLTRLNEISPPGKKPAVENGKEKISEEVARSGSGKGGKRDLYLLLREHQERDEKLKEVWDEVNAIPQWVDWDQV